MDERKSCEVHLTCLCCGTKLQPLFGGQGQPEIDCWKDCIVDTILGGYGSTHDRTMFVIGICDTCLAAKLSDSTIFVKRGPESS